MLRQKKNTVAFRTQKTGAAKNLRQWAITFRPTTKLLRVWNSPPKNGCLWFSKKYMTSSSNDTVVVQTIVEWKWIENYEPRIKYLWNVVFINQFYLWTVAGPVYFSFPAHIPVIGVWFQFGRNAASTRQYSSVEGALLVSLSLSDKRTPLSFPRHCRRRHPQRSILRISGWEKARRCYHHPWQ